MKILGIDEAHRGPLAGPMYIAGVTWESFPEDTLSQIRDSKKLSQKKREELYLKIKEYSDYHVAAIEADELDELGVSSSIKKAIEEILDVLKGKYQVVIFDGSWNPFPEKKYFMSRIKADDKIKQVAAASILAKVEGDLRMVEFDKIYPQYGFAQHKGYGTKQHRDAILEHGLCPIHRLSYHIKTSS